jgi:cytochrome c556
MLKFPGRTLAVAALVPALLAAPLFAAAGDAVKSRIANYRQLGAAYKNVNDELKSGSPQMIVVRMSAKAMRGAAQQQYGWFPQGSGPAAGVKTRAKPAIWTQASAFKTAQDNFATQAEAFARAAQGNNVDQIRAAAKQLGRACAACHRQFREED